MLISTGNNFGAGTIKLQAYQADNYAVLNTRFVVDTSSEAYQAAEVLEIYVPTMRIDRSAYTPVFVAFHDRRGFYGSSLFYDSSTIVRSWIKNQNTICVEKQPAFDEFGTLYFYIATLYPQLNQGIITPKSTKISVVPSADAPYITVANDSFMVVTDHWVFLKAGFSCNQEPYANGTWCFGIQGLPNDVSMHLPLFGGSAQYHYDMTGFTQMQVKNGRFLSNARMTQGTNPTLFAFLVRGDNDGYPMDDYPMAVGDERMRVDIDGAAAYDPERTMKATFELSQAPILLSVEGTGKSGGGSSTGTFEKEPNPKVLPTGETIMIARSRKSGSLAIYSCSFSVNAQYSKINVHTLCDATKYEELSYFDNGLMRNST